MDYSLLVGTLSAPLPAGAGAGGGGGAGGPNFPAFPPGASLLSKRKWRPQRLR